MKTATRMVTKQRAVQKTKMVTQTRMVQKTILGEPKLVATIAQPA